MSGESPAALAEWRWCAELCSQPHRRWGLIQTGVASLLALLLPELFLASEMSKRADCKLCSSPASLPGCFPFSLQGVVMLYHGLHLRMV